MKSILYFGEVKDFSDKWLISLLKNYYKIIIVELNKIKLFKSQKKYNLIINRLYTSSINRHGNKKILTIINILKKFEKKDIPVINSAKGYLLDLDRKKQFKYFFSNNYSFVKTSKINPVLNKKESIDYPYVFKNNTSGRNKTLRIIRNRDELLKLPISMKKSGIVQPLINNKLCYRTEFIGNWDLTFTQLINFQKKSLKFFYTKKIVTTPLSNLFKKKIINTMLKIGVQVFSLEYFIRKNKTPIVIDFNLTSNYHPFLIKRSGNQLKNAWLKLVKNEII